MDTIKSLVITTTGLVLCITSQFMPVFEKYAYLGFGWLFIVIGGIWMHTIITGEDNDNN